MYVKNLFATYSKCSLFLLVLFSCYWLKILIYQTLWWRRMIGFGVDHSCPWILAAPFARCVTLGRTQTFCDPNFPQQKYDVMSVSWVTEKFTDCSVQTSGKVLNLRSILFASSLGACLSLCCCCCRCLCLSVCQSVCQSVSLAIPLSLPPFLLGLPLGMLFPNLHWIRGSPTIHLFYD